MGWCASLSNKWERSIWMEWIPLRLLWLLVARKNWDENLPCRDMWRGCRTRTQFRRAGWCGRKSRLLQLNWKDVTFLSFAHIDMLTKQNIFWHLIRFYTHSLLLQGYITRKVSTVAPWVVDDDRIKRWLHWRTIENWMMYILCLFV